MDILGMLLDSAQSGGVRKAASRIGVSESDAEAMLKKIVPALAGGISNNVAKPGGLENLTKALTRGNHQRYLDEDSALEDASAVTDGNAILGHLLGSKDVSRQVAADASSETGIDASLIKKFLPIAAAAAMAALSKQTRGGTELEKGASSGGDALGLLGGLLGSGGGLSGLLALGRKLL